MANGLMLTHWIGEVINNQDPKKLGRCKIRVYGKFDLLDEETIPWANPMNRELPGSHSVPRVGDVVSVRFENGNVYQPEYSFYVNQNLDLKNEILEESNRQQDVVSLVYDAQRKFRIYFSPENGLIISIGDGKKNAPLIQIDEFGDIRISSDSKIFLDSSNIFISSTGPGEKNEEEPAVKGVSLQNWLNDLLDDYKTHTHPTPSGAPTGIPLPPSPIIIAKLKSTHPTYQQRSQIPVTEKIITTGRSDQNQIENQSQSNIVSSGSTFETSTQQTSSVVSNGSASSIDNFIKNTPWSAAFISYVMKEAQVKFPSNALHTGYLNSIINGKYEFKLLDPKNTKIKIGDLIFLNRAGNNQVFNKKIYTGPSHVDIITEIKNDSMVGIGGNVSNSVTKTSFNSINGIINNQLCFAILRPKSNLVDQIVEILNREWNKWKLNQWKESDIAARSDIKKYYDSVGLGDNIV